MKIVGKLINSWLEEDAKLRATSDLLKYKAIVDKLRRIQAQLKERKVVFFYTMEGQMEKTCVAYKEGIKNPRRTKVYKELYQQLELNEIRGVGYTRDIMDIDSYTKRVINSLN